MNCRGRRANGKLRSYVWRIVSYLKPLVGWDACGPDWSRRRKLFSRVAQLATAFGGTASVPPYDTRCRSTSAVRVSAANRCLPVPARISHPARLTAISSHLRDTAQTRLDTSGC